jgi:hypothetical protein
MDASVARQVKGFTTPEFYHRCHGCTNIVSLILDTKGTFLVGSRAQTGDHRPSGEIRE